jgi:uncharacterized membrane protein
MLIYDISLGLLASVLSMIAISKSKNLYIAIIFPVVFNGLLVGLSLYLALDLPFFLSALEVAIGELLAMIIGIILFKLLERNERFIKMIKFEN